MISYPVLHEGSAVDKHHNVDVPHPYKWMDDVEGAAVRDWLESQTRLSDEFLSQYGFAADIRNLLETMPEFIASSVPSIRGSRQFQFENLEGQPYPVLTLREGEHRTIVLAPGRDGLDPELRIYREFVYISPGGRYVAFGAFHGASDCQNIYVWDIENRKIVGDVIPPILNPVASWAPDDSGFYYNVNSSVVAGAGSVYFRSLQANSDRLIFEFTSGDAHAALPSVTSDGHHLVVKTLNFVTQRAGLYVAPLREPESFRQVFDDGEAFVNVTGVRDNILYLETNWKAPGLQIVSIDLEKPRLYERDTVVPEQLDTIARSTHTVQSTKSCLVGNCIFVVYLVDVSSRIHRYDLSGRLLSVVSIPEFCTVNEIQHSCSHDGLEIALSSFVSPYQHLRYTLENRKTTTIDECRLPREPTPVTVRQEFCKSLDGTHIPMFIISPSSDSTGAGRPVLLYGYGGWGEPVLPEFSPEVAAWTAMGGTYVIANLRGGGEYGSHWHEMGKELNKQNVFDDFCSVAEYLIAEGVATADTLSIKGLSNGGLLVAACVNRRPELFAAAIMEVPLVDVLNILDTSIGPAITAELGDPTASLQEYRYIRDYSPFQNVEAHPDRPPILAVVAAGDERAPPSTAYKYVARLQATAQDGQIVLLRVVDGEGHAGWSWKNVVNTITDEIGFLFLAMNRSRSPKSGTAGDLR